MTQFLLPIGQICQPLPILALPQFDRVAYYMRMLCNPLCCCCSVGHIRASNNTDMIHLLRYDLALSIRPRKSDVNHYWSKGADTQTATTSSPSQSQIAPTKL